MLPGEYVFYTLTPWAGHAVPDCNWETLVDFEATTPGKRHDIGARRPQLCESVGPRGNHPAPRNAFRGTYECCCYVTGVFYLL